MIAHLREEGHDWRHNVHVGTFTAWCTIQPPVSRGWRVGDPVPVDYDPPLPEEMLWHEAGTGYGPDWCTDWDGKLTTGVYADPFADKAAQRGG